MLPKYKLGLFLRSYEGSYDHLINQFIDWDDKKSDELYSRLTDQVIHMVAYVFVCEGTALRVKKQQQQFP